ncbi:MAG: ABC transporter permease [Arcobacteraceae bacterium]|nr:ABC transporter permease [Arcobacteraceae bacterium]
MKNSALFECDTNKGTILEVRCSGDWTKSSVDIVLQNLDIFIVPHKNIVFEISNIKSLDSAGAMVFLEIKKRVEKNGFQVTFDGINDKAHALINLCQKYVLKSLDEEYQKPFILSSMFFKFGQYSFKNWLVLISFLSFVGGLFAVLFQSILNPKKIRFKAILYHLEQNGLNAVPIIVITSLLIGVVIAYQGAVQLEQFGANIFIVEMVAISTTRELAPMIAAIVIAGRSASAFTAQIGVMKITDEVDAMKTMGFNPWEFLVLPRIIALIIALPLLVIVADIVSVYGGMIVASSELGISYKEFIDRFKETVELRHIMIGIIKAPIFGLIIALIGCFRGFAITSSTESVGKYTTISVVNAIFWVIAFNALFSIILTELGI